MARIDRIDTVDRFLAVAGAFLAAREAEHNLLLGISSGLQALRAAEVWRDAGAGARPGPTPAASPAEPAVDFFVVTANGWVVLAALRTPPYNLVLSEVNDPAAVGELADALADDDLPGVLGPAEHAGAFAARWCAANGRTPRLVVSERIYRLTAVRPRPLTPGELRRAGPADRALVVAWYEAFNREALPDDPLTDLTPQVDRRLAEGGIHLWNRGGPVSMAVVGGRTPNGSRIGPVYTPPEHRRQGYASACVAAVSQAELDAGRRFVFLYTDLANPTANRIYQVIGFEPIRDIDVWRFDPPQAPVDCGLSIFDV